MTQKRRDEIPVPIPQVQEDGSLPSFGLPPVSLEEVQMLLGNQAILLLQQQKEIQRLLQIIRTFQNRERGREGDEG